MQKKLSLPTGLRFVKRKDKLFSIKKVQFEKKDKRNSGDVTKTLYPIVRSFRLIVGFKEKAFE
jgi:hypothetical protein